jgi:hypothetical protein
MTEEKPLDILVKSLQDHNLSVDRAGLQKALESDEGATIEAWISEYLGVETFLTKDELSL